MTHLEDVQSRPPMSKCPFTRKIYYGIEETKNDNNPSAINHRLRPTDTDGLR